MASFFLLRFYQTCSKEVNKWGIKSDKDCYHLSDIQKLVSNEVVKIFGNTCTTLSIPISGGGLIMSMID